MYSRILVPIDGSATSPRGLSEAIEVARFQRACAQGGPAETLAERVAA